MLEKKDQETTQNGKNVMPGHKVRWMLVGYDLVIIVAVCAVVMLSGFLGASKMELLPAAMHTLTAALCTMVGRAVIGMRSI